MWIYSRPRSENDIRFLLNLDLCSRIGLTELGEKWYVEVTLESETLPVASAGSNEEATAILTRIFESVRAGDGALDLAASPEQPPRPEGAPAPRPAE
jgi:hypothetical protein